MAVCHPREHLAEAAKQATTSVLTGRTMAEIDTESRAAHEANPALVIEQERAWSDEASVLSNHDGREGRAYEKSALACDVASQMVKEEEPD